MYDAKGLGGDIDGILGLANHKDSEKRHFNYVWALKDSGVISKACVTFSVTNNESYALFGDYNTSQVVDGDKGLVSLKTFGYMPDFVMANKNWAVEGQDLFYGDFPLKDPSLASFPAIIDTGSSTLGVPPNLFDSLKLKWNSTFEKLDCDSSDDFCQLKGDSCENIGKKLKPIGFQLGGQVFEVPPSLYLFQAQDKCQFGIYKNDLGGDTKMFIIGEPLLQHLYMVYDFENEEIKLGVNKSSEESGVKMYPPGRKPV